MPGGCVPAKATALVVGAEAPFVPGVDCQCAWGLRTGEGYRIAEVPFVPGVDCQCAWNWSRLEAPLTLDEEAAERALAAPARRSKIRGGLSKTLADVPAN